MIIKKNILIKNIHFFQEIHCNTNNTRNIRQIGGTLAITAVKELYLNRRFTSSRIWTRQTVEYGKIEIRAAMPKGECIWVEASLYPFHRKREVKVIKFIQFHQKTNEFVVSIDYHDNEKFKNSWTLLNLVNNPNDFYNYKN